MAALTLRDATGGHRVGVVHDLLAAATTAATTHHSPKASAWQGYIVLAVLAVAGYRAFRRLRGAPGRMEARIRNEVRAEMAASAGAGAGAHNDLHLNLSVGTDERGQLVVLAGDHPATMADLPGPEPDPGRRIIDARADRPALPLLERPGVLPTGSGGRARDAIRAAARARSARVPGGGLPGRPGGADVTP